MKTSVLYYSGNTQNPAFEKKITDSLLKTIGKLPLISVTQIPMPELGKNICVGKKDGSYFNEFRQIEIGLKEIKTPYVLVAEADCLYPPEYFSFKPPMLGECYRYNNVWVENLYPRYEPVFFKKGFAHCAQAVDVKMWLKHLAIGFKDQPKWSNNNRLVYDFQLFSKPENHWTGKPVITFKIEGAMRRKTACIDYTPTPSIEYWGSASDLRQKMLV